MEKDSVAGAFRSTFSFVDLAGFSALTEAHGNNAAADLVMRFVSLINRALADHGRVVKTIGDAVLVTTPDPGKAVEFIEKLWDEAGKEPDFPVLRAGLHHGEAVERAGDVFGAAVNLAARVAALARGGQVLATEQVSQAARARGIGVKELGNYGFRNMATSVPLFSLLVGESGGSYVIDPVCRMRVGREGAPGRLTVAGVDYWFCSLNCAALFAQRPDAYTGRS